MSHYDAIIHLLAGGYVFQNILNLTERDFPPAVRAVAAEASADGIFSGRMVLEFRPNWTGFQPRFRCRCHP